MSETIQASPLDVQRPSMLRSWCVVLTAALFFFYIFIQMNLFNAISEALTTELHFTAQQIGYLQTFYFLGNVLFLLPAGILLDRFSVRNLLLAAFALSAIATYVFSITSDIWVIIAVRFVIGLAGAFAMLTAIKLTSRWFKPHHMARVIGVVVSMAFIGGASAQMPLTILTQNLGWRHAMQVVAVLGIALIIIQALVVRDEPKGLEKIETTEHAQLEQLGLWRSLGMVLSNMQNWLSGIYICLINLPIFILGGWGIPYLTQAHGFSMVDAAIPTTLLFVGMMIGSPLAGIASDKMGLRKLPMIIGAILSLIAMMAVIYLSNMPLWITSGIFLLLGLTVSSQVIGYPVLAESNHHTLTGAASSIGSILIMSGGLLIPIYSWLLSLSSKADVTVYSFADFTRANYMMVAGIAIALIASLLIKETHCKQLNK